MPQALDRCRAGSTLERGRSQTSSCNHSGCYHSQDLASSILDRRCAHASRLWAAGNWSTRMYSPASHRSVGSATQILNLIYSMHSMPARSRMLCCARCGANMPQLASLVVHTTRPLTGQSASALQTELIEDLLILRQQVPPLPGSAVLSGSSSQLPVSPAADISGSGRASPEVVADTLPKRARPQRPRLSKSLDKVGCVCQ